PREHGGGMVLDGLISVPRLHVLLIDPDAGAAARLRHAIVAVEHDALVTAVARLAAAVTALRTPGIACVVTELELPDLRGLDVVRALRAARPEVPVIVTTDAGSEEMAVAAMQLGAADYVGKHSATGESLLAAIRAAAGRAVLSGLDDGGTVTLHGLPPADPDFVATTSRMRQVLLLVERAARSRVPVLLEGET